MTDPLGHALRRERPSVEAGPAVHAPPAQFTDRPRSSCARRSAPAAWRWCSPRSSPPGNPPTASGACHDPPRRTDHRGDRRRAGHRCRLRAATRGRGRHRRARRPQCRGRRRARRDAGRSGQGRRPSARRRRPDVLPHARRADRRGPRPGGRAGQQRRGVLHDHDEAVLGDHRRRVGRGARGEPARPVAAGVRAAAVAPSVRLRQRGQHRLRRRGARPPRLPALRRGQGRRARDDLVDGARARRVRDPGQHPLARPRLHRGASRRPSPRRRKRRCSPRSACAARPNPTT